MAGNIYSADRLKGHSVKRRDVPRQARSVRPVTEKTRRNWVPTAAAAILTLLVSLTINYRAHSNFSLEAAENETLNKDVMNLTNENIVLQEEIQKLRSDSQAIEREARKFGLERSHKVPVQTK